MDLYQKIIKIADANLIHCLVPMILTLILIEFLFKNRFPTKKALWLFKWIIISYTGVTAIYFVTGIVFHPDEFEFMDRATGPYKTAYWIMLSAAVLLPFTLLIKNFGSKFWYVLIVAFLMKIGAAFERFVIIATSIHRDYTPENWGSDTLKSWMFWLLMILLQGALLTILTLGIFMLIEKRKNATNSR